MNRETLAARVTVLLDEEARHHPEGIKSSDLKYAVHEQVVALLADLDRDLDAEAEAVVTEVASHTRKTRRASMEKTLDYILDAFESSESSAYVDPMMDLAFPLGTADGMVKALKFWTEDDWTGSTLAAYENAANVTAAAQAYAERVERVKRSMRARGVEMFGVEQ